MVNPTLHSIIFAAVEAGGADAAATAAVSKPDLPFFSIIIFALMVAILAKFAWKPIRSALDDRERTLGNELDEARQQNELAARQLKEQEERLADVKAEVESLIAKSREDAEAQKQSILAEARQAAESEKQRAIREIDAAKNNALQELADRSVGTAVDLAGRIVGKQLTKGDHTNLIEEALKQFTNKN